MRPVDGYTGFFFFFCIRPGTTLGCALRRRVDWWVDPADPLQELDDCRRRAAQDFRQRLHRLHRLIRCWMVLKRLEFIDAWISSTCWRCRNLAPSARRIFVLADCSSWLSTTRGHWTQDSGVDGVFGHFIALASDSPGVEVSISPNLPVGDPT